VANYLPHTPEDVRSMLDFLGVDDLDGLFAHIPEALRVAGGLALPDGMSEPDAAARFAAYGRANVATTATHVCFAGAGAYDHEVPPVVRALASRTEFVTAYTPYQPEVAQGVLQAIFEYQTMIARLSGLPIANASLYDGATALVEAVNMAAGASGRNKMVISAGVHPHWRATVTTFARGTGYEVLVAPLRDGVTDWSGVDCAGAAAVVSAYPNYLGVLEDLSTAKSLASEHGALFVVAGDPVLAAVLPTAGAWGADVYVGEGQPFGTALSFGGPYLGLFACTSEQVRRLPGRLVGETVDTEGKRAFVTTLRAREQDIRREKATSNVCTNQTLMAVAAAVQLSYLGTNGLREVATRSIQGAHYLHGQMAGVHGVRYLTTTPFGREFALATPRRGADVIADLAGEGFLGGVALSDLGGDHDPSLSDVDLAQGVLIAVTERRTMDEIDRFVEAIRKVTK
jgi:glycine dehydrogenase subunit 1